MAAIKPIHKKLLIHEVTIDGALYTGVRMEFTNTRVSESYGQIVKSSHLLFIDKINTPNYEDIKALINIGDRIDWMGKRLTIDNYEILSGYTEHHMEVYLT